MDSANSSLRRRSRRSLPSACYTRNRRRSSDTHVSVRSSEFSDAESVSIKEEFDSDEFVNSLASAVVESPDYVMFQWGNEVHEVGNFVDTVDLASPDLGFVSTVTDDDRSKSPPSYNEKISPSSNKKAKSDQDESHVLLVDHDDSSFEGLASTSKAPTF